MLPRLPKKFEDMNLSEQQQLIAKIFATGTPISLIGGIAVDILIDGQLDRLHKDFDAIALGSDVDIIRNKLEGIGLTITESRGTTKKIEIYDGGIQVGAVGLAEIDEEGKPFLTISLSGGAGYELHYSSDFFGAIHPIPGGQARVVSPTGLLQTLNTNFAIDKPMRDKDVTSRNLIQTRYFPNQPADSPAFIPRVVKL